MKKTANLKRGRKHGSYDVIPVCVRMRKDILRVLLLTQNIKFTASWVRRVFSEVVLPVLHMLSILLRSKTAPVSQLSGSFVFTTMSSTWSKSAKAQQKLFICFIFLFFLFLFLWRLSGQRLCVQLKFLWRLFALDGSSQHSVCGCAADNKLEVEHCPFVPPYEQY